MGIPDGQDLSGSIAAYYDKVLLNRLQKVMRQTRKPIRSEFSTWLKKFKRQYERKRSNKTNAL